MLMITEQHFGSAGMIVFILAYLSKGMRRSSANTKTEVPAKRNNGILV